MSPTQLPHLRPNQTMKNIFIGLLSVAAVIALIGMYSRPLEKREDVSLSRIVQEINSGKVAALTVNQDDVMATLKDNSQSKLVAQHEVNTSITETFRNLGISEDKLNALELTVKKPSGFSYWLATLIPLLLPFILLGAFLWFMMRSAQNVGNRAMSFGQVTTRPVEADQKKKTTFADVAGNVEAKQEL